MAHSWRAYDLAKKIIVMLEEMSLLKSLSQTKKDIIQGNIQIIIEES